MNLDIFIGYAYHKGYLIRRAKIFLFLLSLGIFCYVSVPFGSNKSPIVNGIIGCVLVFCSVQLKSPKSIMAGLFDSLGRASYSIYLVSAAILLFDYPRTPWGTFAFIAAMTGISIGINRVYEEPILKYVKVKLAIRNKK